MENTAPLPPVLPKTYAEQTDDRLVLIKDRLQLLKDQAAPLRGASMRMANTRIKTIETKIHAADKEVGHLRRQAITPAQQQAISRQLAQIEYDIDQASQEIATHQERR